MRIYIYSSAISLLMFSIWKQFIYISISFDFIGFYRMANTSIDITH